MALLAVVLVSTSGRAHAAEFTVTRNDDPAPNGCLVDDCSLREAIIAANTAGGVTVHEITLAAGTYATTRTGEGTENASAVGDLDVTARMIIMGAGAALTMIDGDALEHRVLHVRPGATLTLVDLTVANGYAVCGVSSGAGGGVYVEGGIFTADTVVFDENYAEKGGGGIYADGAAELELVDVTLRSNRARVASHGGAVHVNSATASLLATRAEFVENLSMGGDGGALYLTGGMSAGLVDCTVAQNIAKRGAGIGVANAALSVDGTTIVENMGTDRGAGIAIIGASSTVSLVNSTLSGNSTTGDGGGAALSGATDITLWHVTVTGNSAGSAQQDADGGGLVVDGNVEITASVIADNTASATGQDLSGTFVSGGYNVLGTGDGVTGFDTDSAGDVAGTDAAPVDARLAALGDNGGNTETHLPDQKSVALNLVPSGDLCAATDQRDLERPLGDACDAGAVEAEILDTDTDLVDDPTDNCVDAVNAGQEDADEDGFGDACDNCAGVANGDQSDLNEDGEGDACDDDDDGDGLTDGEEDAAGLNPRDPVDGANVDSDGDFLSNADEIRDYGTDPLNDDSDGDDIPDGWEVQFELDPTDPADGEMDTDGDGRTNAREYVDGTNPTRPDSDPTDDDDNDGGGGSSGGCAVQSSGDSGGSGALLTLALVALVRGRRRRARVRA